MKRSSLIFQRNPIRNSKRRKTDGHRAKQKAMKRVPVVQEAEIIVASLVHDFFSDLENKIDQVNEREAHHKLNENCYHLFRNILTLNSPEHHESCEKIVSEDREPPRIRFDPICGFDKLKTFRNYQIKLNRKSSEKETNCNMEGRTQKSSAFGVFQNGKKQFQKARNMKEQLIPLIESKLDMTEREEEDKETLIRQRFLDFYNIEMSEKRNINFSNEKQLKKPEIALKASHQQEECQYDYNGDKINISATRTNFGKAPLSHVLKTSYRILEKMNSEEKVSTKNKLNALKKVERRHNLSRDSIVLNKNSVKLETTRENIISSAFCKTNHSQNHDLLIKNMVEARFKENKVKLKQIEKAAPNQGSSK